MKKYANVIVSINNKEVDRIFTYKIPDKFQNTIEIGMRVLVPFGNRKQPMDGFVMDFSNEIDFDESKLKEILVLPDATPFFSRGMISLAHWMKEKYYTTLASCLKCIMPAGMNVKSDFIYSVSDIKNEKFTKKTQDVINYILDNDNKVAFTELEENFPNVFKTLKPLEEKKILEKIPVSKVKDYVVKIKYAYIHHEAEQDEIEKIIKDGKQQGAILELLSEHHWLPVKDICSFLKISKSPVTTLEKNNFIVIEDVEARRNVSMSDGVLTNKDLILNEEQLNVINFFKTELDNENKKPALLFGVTGSGKTEVYMEIIEEVINRGQQAIVLVPEISLTPQTVGRFTNRFKEKVAVTHSKLSLGERYDQWKKARDSEISIMIGPRSAIFAPFNNLGVIIIDEEHETSYISDTTPKYNTRDVAIKLGEITNSLVILGSATPNIDTYHKSEQNIFNRLEMKKRANKKEPEIEIVDMRKELESGNRSIFSRGLYEALCKNIENNQQSILFLNRRGHSTFISCRACGYVLTCTDCSVNYTYHRHNNKIACHYCGKEKVHPKNCPQCGSKYIKLFGIGTQKVEEAVKELFPNENILRMDSDTVSKKFGHEQILKKFRNQESKILIGTQMIAKGLDFPNVTLVGIIAADISINNGDFKSSETTFQLLSQVSGRAGRGDYDGKVFIQTYNPEHYAIVLAKENDYEQFYNFEISVRKQLSYPPFSNIFSIIFISSDEKKIIICLNMLSDIMKHYNRNEQFDVLGPAPCEISKIKNKYRWKIIVKGIDEVRLKSYVFYCLDKLSKVETLTNIEINGTLNPSVIQ